MNLDLTQRLAASLGSAFAFQRELGGGGMSRVFLAEETALGRPVVIKVISPELAEGLSLERFEREIRVAARLQQANIVPVLRAGEVDGLPYYTMPFVAGESLRARLATGHVPLRDALAILRDVAKALAYAHAAGVVHRDIKPENVLLSGGTAVVTDFGIAKAITASRDAANGTSGLTAFGTSLGTPAYMAPEQAAGDPDTDARADLYAWGLLAHEVLTRVHPFAHHQSVHDLVRAHLVETPRDLTTVAPAVPRDVATVVMRCLAKSPADRPQSAEEILSVLDESQTSGSMESAHKRVGLAGALGIYIVALVATVAAARVSTTLLGLPMWVVGGTLFVMALGFPLVLLTGLVERQRTQPLATPGSRSAFAEFAMRYRRRLTWRRTMLGGAAALGVFALGVAGYMASRSYGVGPFASLIGARALEVSDRIVVGSMRGPEGDAGLGDVLAEGLRADLSQSNALRLVSSERASMLLAQMEQPGVPIVGPVARELAERAGAKAILDGEVRKIGSAYALTVRLLPATGADPLVMLQEAAKNDADFTAATGRISKRLRERVGESLRSVNSAPPLFEVTTQSLPALRKYTEAINAARRGDYFRTIGLAQEAIAIDSGFVAAHMLIGSTISFASGMRQAQSEALERAYAARERATPLERKLVEYHYWLEGPTPDLDRAGAAVQAAYAIDPGEANSELTPFAFLRRDFRRTIALSHEGLDADSARTFLILYQAMAHAELGEMDSARAAIQRMRTLQPAHPAGLVFQAQLLAHDGDYSSASRIGAAIESAAPVVEWGAFIQGGVAELTGRLAETETAYRRAFATMSGRGVASARALELSSRAYRQATYYGDTAGAVRMLDSLVRFELQSVPPRERPYEEIAIASIAAGRISQARTMLEGLRRDDPARRWSNQMRSVDIVEGIVARAEGKYSEAVKALRLTTGFKPGIAALAYTFDAAGQQDSAVVYYERYVRSGSLDFSLWSDAMHLARCRQRLAELYEQRGSHALAAEQWRALIRQLENADPELQPIVAMARQHLTLAQRNKL